MKIEKEGPKNNGDVYPITHVGRFFASIISLVGIGIIAIPTGIIAAGFNQVITREKEESVTKEPHERDVIEEMNHDELLALQSRIVKKLSDDGYFQNKK